MGEWRGSWDGEKRNHYNYKERNSGASNSWRPPNPTGPEYFSVPLWEKKFCTYVCDIPWKRLCETKRFMSMYKNIVQWDDSAALEAFQNAKARFHAEYHGLHCDIPLPNPDMYIDEVDPNAIIDPDLIADLESQPPAPADRDNSAPNGWDSFTYTDKPIPATGWDDAEPNAVSDQNQSVNWDIYVEKPSQATFSSSWDVKDESLNAWNCSSRGWGEGNEQHNSWASNKRNDNWGNVRSGSWGHWENRNKETSRRNGRKRDGGGGRFYARVTKPKYHEVDGYQSNNSWRGCRGRNNTNSDKVAYAKPPLAM
ncbi:hypothetical protein ACMD2_13334 [Ananas comosus]|uniref:Uncharacterized protein n=1 Tax=Ananas comosus TaxID=4615 RepID=A0A199UEJ9_ANACO|nr:hypothetical protein ACMD2_13334 [Ananas comosus]